MRRGHSTHDSTLCMGHYGSLGFADRAEFSANQHVREPSISLDILGRTNGEDGGSPAVCGPAYRHRRVWLFNTRILPSTTTANHRFGSSSLVNNSAHEPCVLGTGDASECCKQTPSSHALLGDSKLKQDTTVSSHKDIPSKKSNPEETFQTIGAKDQVLMNDASTPPLLRGQVLTSHLTMALHIKLCSPRKWPTMSIPPSRTGWLEPARLPGPLAAGEGVTIALPPSHPALARQ